MIVQQREEIRKWAEADVPYGIYDRSQFLAAQRAVKFLLDALDAAEAQAAKYREALEEVLDGWQRDRTGALPCSPEEYYLRRDMGRNALA